MTGHLPFVLGRVFGGAALVVFWAACLLGTAAVIGAAALALGLATGGSILLVLLCFAANALVLTRVAGDSGLWSGM
jgi:hypothetical protein